MLTPWKKSYDQPRKHIKKQRHYFANKDPSSQGYGFSSGYGWMWELDHKESCVLKNWPFWTVALAKTPLDIQSILKEISPEYSLEGLMLKLKLQSFGHLMWRADSSEKTLMLGKTEGGKRRGWQRMRLVGWHHRLNGHEFKQTPGDSEGQGSLACHSPWGCKESNMTYQLNNNGIPREF